MESSRWAKAEEAPPPSTAPAPDPVPQPERIAPTPSTVAAAPTHEVFETLDNDEDTFAQTRGDDDLFDDDFTPVAPSAVATTTTAPNPSSSFSSNSNQGSNSIHASRYSTGPSEAGFEGADRGGPRGRGRGRGRGLGRGSVTPAAWSGPGTPNNKARKDGEAAVEDGASTAATTAAVVAADGDKKTPVKEAAVRGDRSGTGGVRKAKLTQTELDARLEAMRSKNASLAEAHRRAEADQEAFQAREAVALARRQAERSSRREMMGEREKNRQRKLQAQGGREWDVGKDEAAALSTSQRALQSPAQHSKGEDEDEAEAGAESGGGRGRGRGGVRGRDRGRGRGPGPGRGGRGGASKGEAGGQASRQQKPPTASDFPELPIRPSDPSKSSKATVTPPKVLSIPLRKIEPKPPAATKDAEEPKGPPAVDTQSKSGTEAGANGILSPVRDWADEVEKGER